LEKFFIEIFSLDRIKDGKDRRIIDKAIGDRNLEEMLPLVYEVKLYTFSVGDNCFTMGVIDKEKCFKDRKPVVVKLLKNKEYYRALKMLKFLKDIIEMVNNNIQNLGH
jgi:hypothetical protein